MLLKFEFFFILFVFYDLLVVVGEVVLVVVVLGFLFGVMEIMDCFVIEVVEVVV